jgi:F0F1-type ATP synthase membrane subunit b/b'
VGELERILKEAWTRAAAGVGAAEQEAERLLGRVTGLAPEELRRQAKEIAARLDAQRQALEKAVGGGVRSAASRLAMPSSEELEALKKRMDDLTARVEAMGQARRDDTERKP